MQFLIISNIKLIYVILLIIEMTIFHSSMYECSYLKSNTFNKNKSSIDLNSKLNITTTETSDKNITKNTTKPCGDNKNSSNTVGKIGSPYLAVSVRPFKLTSCDQVLIIKTNTLINSDDYLSRSEAYFTMSMYLINKFSSNESKSLTDSIYLDSITKFPYVLRGTKTCLSFEDNKTSKSIIMCLSEKSELEEIKDVYEDFLACRRGDNLNKRKDKTDCTFSKLANDEKQTKMYLKKLSNLLKYEKIMSSGFGQYKD
jgi:hypothetical protein